MKEENTIAGNIVGLQHIGIPVSNLDVSVDFYQKLGFRCSMHRELTQTTEVIKVSMMQYGNIIIELYQSGSCLKKDSTKKDGFIDHIAFDVQNIDDIYQKITQNGIKVIEGPATLGFWEKGCKYFTIRGPEGEKLEFNEIIK